MPDYLLRLVKRWLVRLLVWPVDKALPPATAADRQAIGELRDKLRPLAIARKPGETPSEAAWNRNVNRLRQLVLARDPRNFLRWDIIDYTMFISYAPYIQRELDYLRAHPAWAARWRGALVETPVGHPVPWIHYPTSSGNLIHHAYHLAQFEENTGKPVDRIPLVLEFGGGYGSLCRVFHTLGFTGKYIIFDFPHFNALQRFFLRSLGLNVHTTPADFRAADSGIICISSLEDLHSLLPSTPGAPDMLFVATWSLSETPLALRKIFMPLIDNATSFLLAYQHRFGEVDNVRFFEQWCADRNVPMTWTRREISHTPGNSYLFGLRA